MSLPADPDTGVWSAGQLLELRSGDHTIAVSDLIGMIGDFNTWLDHGIKQGWVSEGYCAMHDTFPMTEEEAAYFDDGGDPCIPALRVWIDKTEEPG